MAGADVVVGRQAIYDRRLDIIGYELLFRTVGSDTGPAPDQDGDLMTSEVILSSISIGIDRLVGDKLLFCNADRGLLLGELDVTLPPAQTVIEVLETVEIDEQVLAGCRSLVQQGYRLALDDFLWFPGAEQILELAWMVKIDLRLVGPEELGQLAARCRAFGVVLLAEKIETAAELATCQELGFDYFQGYYLQRPRIIPGRSIDTSHLGRMRVAAYLLSEEIDFDKLEHIIRTEPGLALHILHLASIGSRNGTRRDIGSLRQALVMTGARRIQSWVALLMLARPGQTSPDDIAAVLTRARMCELLAAGLDPASASMAFTAGLLSAFDLVLGMPVSDILQALPLDEPLRAAAFDHAGPLGEVVADVVALQAEPDGLGHLDGRYGISLHLAAIRALTWAVEATGGLPSAPVAAPAVVRSAEEAESA